MADAPYLTLKLANQLYRKSPDTLDAAEKRSVAEVADRQQQIETRILSSAAAAGVILPQSSVMRCFEEIRDRYLTEPEFHAELQRVGLDPDQLRQAIERDLKVEAVLEQIAAGVPPVGTAEIERYYSSRPGRFRRPETRTLRHILITVNPALPGSDRASAQTRIAALAAQLAHHPERFGELALRYSECPTATNGGMLGRVTRGQLYPELEAPAFALAVGGLSPAVESPLGFHLIRCEGIQEAAQLALAEVADRIRELLEQKRRTAAQKEWIAALFRN